MVNKIKSTNKTTARKAAGKATDRLTSTSARRLDGARTPSTRLVSTPAEPLVNYQTYKMRRSTIAALDKAAAARGWSTAALVRDVLDKWARRHEGK